MALQNSDTVNKSITSNRKKVKARVKNSTHALSNSLIHKIDSTRDAINNFVDTVEEYAEQGIKVSEQRIQYAKDQTEAVLDYIDEKPLRSACIAFSAGYLLQKIFR